MEFPETLYYTTILFSDGRQMTPPFFVFDQLPEGITMLRKYYDEMHTDVEAYIIKELKFVQTKVLNEDAVIVVPHTDGTIVEELDPEEQEKMVAKAELGDPSESLMVIFPEEQEAEDLLCKAFYMGPFLKAATAEELESALLSEPFVAATPIDYVLLYRPTGDMKEVKS